MRESTSFPGSSPTRNKVAEKHAAGVKCGNTSNSDVLRRCAAGIKRAKTCKFCRQPRSQGFCPFFRPSHFLREKALGTNQGGKYTQRGEKSTWPSYSCLIFFIRWCQAFRRPDQERSCAVYWERLLLINPMSLVTFPPWLIRQWWKKLYDSILKLHRKLGPNTANRDLWCTDHND